MATKKSSNQKRTNNGNDSLDEMNITKDEFSKITEAFKNDEFKKMFLEYCDELKDPENRKQYENEIIQLESERGVECKFVNPEPGFVVKTSVDGGKKGFINIASNNLIERPRSEVKFIEETGQKGLNWSIPYAQAPPRRDYDNQKQQCVVYDVIFHPDALHLATRNNEFRRHLIDTACDAVEREFKVQLDRTNLKFPKMKYKGLSRPTVIRKIVKNEEKNESEVNPVDAVIDSFMPPLPNNEVKPKIIESKWNKKPQNMYEAPKYIIKHRRDVDFTEMTYELDAKLNVTVPKDLIVEIDLPLLKSTSDCTLDVTEKQLFLISESPAKYKLNVALPYKVNDKNGSAKFDKITKKLKIILPVSNEMEKKVRDLNREDSGVESDMREDTGLSPTTIKPPLIEELISDHYQENKEKSHDKKPSKKCNELLMENIELNNEIEKKNTNENICDECTIEDFTSADDVNAKSNEIQEVSHENEDNFLNDSIQYNFPQHFDCNRLNDNLVYVLHVKNVDPQSIIYKETDNSIQLKFTSIGSGYYPIHYSFYCLLEYAKISKIDTEAWDNNIILTLVLSDFDNLHKYSAGLNSKILQSYKISEKFLMDNFNNVINEAGIQNSQSSQLNVKTTHYSDGEIEISVTPKESQTSLNDVEKSSLEEKTTKNKKKKNNKKRRSYSESACDDFKYSTEDEQDKLQNNELSPENAGRKTRSFSECRDLKITNSFKGILKRYSRYGRSTSESYSSMDESCSFSIDPNDSFGNIPEEECESNGLSESCKKTVRFSNVIQKQLFRLDSSILGQKKKNQKRKLKKQQLLQRRRNSEGDSIEYEEKSPRLDSPFEERTSQECDLKDVDNKNSSNERHLSTSESDCETNKNSLIFDIEI